MPISHDNGEESPREQLARRAFLIGFGCARYSDCDDATAWAATMALIEDNADADEITITSVAKWIDAISMIDPEEVFDYYHKCGGDV